MTETSTGFKREPAPDRVVSGRWIVVVILGIGVVASAALWWYTELHRRPFRPLREAIAREFPRSAPKVEGGQRKAHRGTPRILRITLQVEFDPNEDEARTRTMIAVLGRLAREYGQVDQYAVFEVHLVKFRPEQTAIKYHVELSAESLAREPEP